MADEDYINTGFENLDRRFEGKGLPVGTICSIKSDPNAPANSLLLQLYQEADPNGFYFTPSIPEPKIKHQLRNLGMSTEYVSGVHGHGRINTTDDIVDTLDDVDFEGGEVVVIGAMSEVEVGDTGLNDFYARVATVAVEKEILVVIHHAENDSDRKLDTHIADAVLSMTQSRSGDDITQTLYIERMPPGQRLREMYDGGRAMGLSDIQSRLEITSSLRI